MRDGAETVVLVEGSAEMSILGALEGLSKTRLQLINARGRDNVMYFTGRHSNRTRRLEDAPKFRLLGVVDRDFWLQCCNSKRGVCRTLCTKDRIENGEAALTDYTDLESDLYFLGVLYQVLRIKGGEPNEVEDALAIATSIAAEIGYLRHTNKKNNWNWAFRNDDGSAPRENWQHVCLVLGPLIRDLREPDGMTLSIDLHWKKVSMRFSTTHPQPDYSVEKWAIDTGGKVFNGKDLIVALMEIARTDRRIASVLAGLEPPSEQGPWSEMALTAECCRKLHEEVLIAAGEMSAWPNWSLYGALSDAVSV